MRRKLEVAVERLLAILDALDGDPDLEPCLAWTAAGVLGGNDDREDNGDDLEEDYGFLGVP
jgi:hypothetical protein